MQHLLENEGRQAQSVDGADQSGGLGVRRIESPTLEQDSDEDAGYCDQRDGSGDRQRQRHLGRARQGVASALGVASLKATRQVGEKDDADGDAHHAERKLVEPVGVGQPGDGAVEEAGDLSSDEKVDLHHPAREHRRPGNEGETLEVGRPNGPLRSQVEAGSADGDPDHRHLRNSRDDDPEGEERAVGRTRLGGIDDAEVREDVFGRQKASDEDDVEQHGRGGGCDEAARRVQDAREQRCERDEEDIGKDDPPECDGDRQPFVARKARGHGKDEPGHEDRGEDREDDQDGRQS